MNLMRRLPPALRMDAMIVLYALAAAWLVFSGL